VIFGDDPDVGVRPSTDLRGSARGFPRFRGTLSLAIYRNLAQTDEYEEAHAETSRSIDPMAFSRS